MIRECRYCRQEFSHGLLNPKLWWHGITLWWRCPDVLRLRAKGRKERG